MNFTGEMVFPWMFDDFAALQPYQEAAELLAAKQDWPVLYNQQVLAANKVRLVGRGGGYPMLRWADVDAGMLTEGVHQHWGCVTIVVACVRGLSPAVL